MSITVSYTHLNEANEEKLPVILFILNNYEGITEIYQDIYEDIASLTRDCHRYGIRCV